MDRSLQTVGFALLAWLAFAPAACLAADKSTSLKLKLSASSAPVQPRSVRNPRRPAHFQQALPSVSQRALQSLLQDADDNAQPATGGNEDRFRFKRRGDMGRDLRAGYNSVCDSVSNKIWDEPDGKRVRFDVAGKPGLALEIPLR